MTLGQENSRVGVNEWSAKAIMILGAFLFTCLMVMEKAYLKTRCAWTSMEVMGMGDAASTNGDRSGV